MDKYSGFVKCNPPELDGRHCKERGHRKVFSEALDLVESFIESGDECWGRTFDRRERPPFNADAEAAAMYLGRLANDNGGMFVCRVNRTVYLVRGERKDYVKWKMSTDTTR